MKYKITEATNFLRVFRLPNDFPEGYYFKGGCPVEFQMVDWFNAFDQQDFWGVKTKQFDSASKEYIEHVEMLKDFIKGKKYFELFPKNTFMVMTDYGDVFMVNQELRAHRLQKQMDELNKKIKERNTNV